MRSDLVFNALGQTQGRYRLCRLTAKAGRKLQTRKTRIQDTLNNVLSLISHSAAPADADLSGAEQAAVDLAPDKVHGSREELKEGHTPFQSGFANPICFLSTANADRKSRAFENGPQMIVGPQNREEERA